MSSSNLSGLSDQIGPLEPNTPIEQHIVLLHALRSAQTADDQRGLLEHLFGEDGPK